MATVLLTGATGFIGSAVLPRLLQDPSVAKVITLQRRPLSSDSPAQASPKHHSIVIKEESAWTDYPATVKEQLSAVDAVVWALGSPYYNDMQLARRVCFEYTLYAIQTLLNARGESTKSLRFVYLSGGLTVKDQEQSVLLLGAVRKLRGRTETELLDEAEKQKGRLEFFIARPGPVTGPSRGFVANALVRIVFGQKCIDVEPLGAALAALALHEEKLQGQSDRLVENAQLQVLGAAALG